MDIVSRLKRFLQESGIPNSQFADACRIPRPTLSQILNGRNKKISDELIAKIHEAFPNLSIMWLMFGEGEMGIDGNIEISAAQKSDIFNFDSQQSADDQQFDSANSFPQSLFETTSNRFSPEFLENHSSSASAIGVDSIDFSVPPSKNESSSQKPLTSVPPVASTDGATGAVSIATDLSKKITNIVVFYSDNSFQSFSPSDR